MSIDLSGYSLGTPYATGATQVYSGNIVLVKLSPIGRTVLNPNNANQASQLQANQKGVKFVGLGQTLTVNRDAGLTSADGMGDNRVQQWVPGLATVSATVTDLVVRKSIFTKTTLERTYESLGVAPIALIDLLVMNTFDLELVDMESGATLKTIQYCTYSTDTLNVQKHVPFTVDVTFNGIESAGNMTPDLAS